MLGAALGEKQGIANPLNNLGILAQNQGDYAAARALFEESLMVYRELGNRQGTAFPLMNLGTLAQQQGDYVSARVLQNESLVIFHELGDKQGIANSLGAHASLDSLEQHTLRAAQLWGAVTSLREAISLPRPPDEREIYETEVARARLALGEPAFTAAFEQGRAMSWGQSVDLALGA